MHASGRLTMPLEMMAAKKTTMGDKGSQAPLILAIFCASEAAQ